MGVREILEIVLLPLKPDHASNIETYNFAKLACHHLDECLKIQLEVWIFRQNEDLYGN